MFNEHEKKHHFLERARALASHLDLPHELVPHIAEHLHHFSHGRSPIIWIQGMNCTGCSVAFLDSEHFHAVDLDFGKTSLRYQPDVMAASGYQAIQSIEDAESEDRERFLLVVEGAIPRDGGEAYCTFGPGNGEKQLGDNIVPDDRTIYEWMEELVPNSAAVVAVGNCASYGGIPLEMSDVTGATPVSEVVSRICGEKKVINVAGCPPHPDWLMGTLMDVLLWTSGNKDEPELDDKGRLTRFYSQFIHDNCDRRPAFEAKEFLLSWNEPPEGKCLLKMGCRGPKTHADCPVRRWNEHLNWCVDSNVPCQGCTEPGFHKKFPHTLAK